MERTPHRAEFDVAFRIRLLRLASWIIIVIGVPFVFQYARIGVPWMSVAVLGTIVGGLINLRILNTTQRVVLCGNLGTSMLFVLLVLSNIASGGFYDPNMGWLYVIPVIAGLMLDRWHAAVYGLLVIGVTALFFAVEQWGPGLTDHIPPR